MKIDLRTQQGALDYLKSLGDSPVELPSGGELESAASDAVSALAGEHCSAFARGWKRWRWKASELVEHFTNVGEE